MSTDPELHKIMLALGRIEQKTDGNTKRINHLTKTLEGNGKPGLIHQMAQMRFTVKLTLAAAGVIGTGGIAIATAAIQRWLFGA